MHFISEMSATLSEQSFAHYKTNKQHAIFRAASNMGPDFVDLCNVEDKNICLLRHRWGGGESKLIQNWCRVKVSGSRREFDGLVSTRAQALNESRALKPATSGIKQVVCYFLDIISPLNTCLKKIAS